MENKDGTTVTASRGSPCSFNRSIWPKIRRLPPQVAPCPAWQTQTTARQHAVCTSLGWPRNRRNCSNAFRQHGHTESPCLPPSSTPKLHFPQHPTLPPNQVRKLAAQHHKKLAKTREMHQHHRIANHDWPIMARTRWHSPSLHWPIPGCSHHF